MIIAAFCACLLLAPVPERPEPGYFIEKVFPSLPVTSGKEFLNHHRLPDREVEIEEGHKGRSRSPPIKTLLTVKRVRAVGWTL